jgi:hypothetical protein
MSLTPKNWKSFQHYKERTPAWIKLHKGLLTDFAFNRLPLASRALAPMLWLLASEYEDGEITASMDEIAFRLHVSVSDLQSALKPLVDSGFFVASEALAEPEQDAIPEKRREEDIEKRTREEEETDSRSVADATRPNASDFDEFWKAYPRRDGPNPRKPAEQKFNALAKTGVDPAMMIAAVKRMALDQARDIGTRFIPQAVTWLNQQRWTDHAAVAFSASSIPDKIPLEDAVRQYAKTGHWSRHAPVADISQAPAELLAKHGLSADGRRIQ